jgi:putative hydrolase of the HAD superfamily
VVQAVLFDVDGVLVHPWRFRAALARDHGITPDMTASFFKGPFLDCVQGRADLIDVLPPFLASWGWVGSASDFVGEWLSAENAPNEAVLSVVADIRRCAVPCFVASTQERRRARYLASEMRFNQLFDGLFFSSDVGVEKPNEGFLKAVAHHLGRSGMELLFFDDAVVNVEGARSAGWLAEQFTSVEGLRTDVAATRGLLSMLADIQMEPARLTASYNHVAEARGSFGRYTD